MLSRCFFLQRNSDPPAQIIKITVKVSTCGRKVRFVDPKMINMNQLQEDSDYSFFISFSKYLMSLLDFENLLLKYPALPTHDLLQNKIPSHILIYLH